MQLSLCGGMLAVITVQSSAPWLDSTKLQSGQESRYPPELKTALHIAVILFDLYRFHLTELVGHTGTHSLIITFSFCPDSDFCFLSICWQKVLKVWFWKVKMNFWRWTTPFSLLQTDTNHEFKELVTQPAAKSVPHFVGHSSLVMPLLPSNLQTKSTITFTFFVQTVCFYSGQRQKITAAIL